MAESHHDPDVQQLDSRNHNDTKNTANHPPRNVQGEPPVSVPATLLERPTPKRCKTCDAPCIAAQWLVPEFLGGGWACCREHVK